MGLVDDAGDEEEPDEREEYAEPAVDRVGTLARDELRAHDHALGPHLEPHHEIGPDGGRTAECKEKQSNDRCNHLPILHPSHHQIR